MQDDISLGVLKIDFIDLFPSACEPPTPCFLFSSRGLCRLIALPFYQAANLPPCSDRSLFRLFSTVLIMASACTFFMFFDLTSHIALFLSVFLGRVCLIPSRRTDPSCAAPEATPPFHSKHEAVRFFSLSPHSESTAMSDHTSASLYSFFARTFDPLFPPRPGENFHRLHYLPTFSEASPLVRLTFTPPLPL